MTWNLQKVISSLLDLLNAITQMLMAIWDIRTKVGLIYIFS